MTSDINKARALYRNALDILDSLPKTGGARFFLMNYYSIILDLIQGILAADGIKHAGINHHKESIEYVATTYALSNYELTMLENLRFIRNDIQYYGTKSTRDLNEFMEFNKTAILKLIAVLDKLLGKKL